MIDPIDDELREYVDAFKNLDHPTDAARAATWADIEARLTSDPVPLARARRPAVIAAIAAALALCFGLTAAAVWRDRIAVDNAASHHTDAPSITPLTPPTATSTSAAPSLAPIDPTPSLAPLAPSLAPIDPSLPPIAPSTTLPPPLERRSKRTRRPALEQSLRPEEVASFRRAQAALADGEYADALRSLDEHGRRYPGGFFEEERLLSRAAALCELGRTAAARTVRDDFLRDRPASHLRDRMRHTCREIE